MNNLLCFYCKQFVARLTDTEAEETNGGEWVEERVQAGAIFCRRKAIKCVEHNKLQKETNKQPGANEYEWGRGRAHC